MYLKSLRHAALNKLLLCLMQQVYVRVILNEKWDSNVRDLF